MLALLLFAFIAQICSGYVLRGYVDDRLFPLSQQEIDLSTVQLLSDGANGELPFQETHLRNIDGHFIFSNVTVGEYLLTLSSGLLETSGEKLKVTVTREQVTINTVFDGHDYKTDLGPTSEYPLVIRPVHRPKFIVARESFSLFSMLKSPMMLLTIGSVAMVFLFPKLMEGIGMSNIRQQSNNKHILTYIKDPEALKKLQEENQKAKENISAQRTAATGQAASVGNAQASGNSVSNANKAKGSRKAR